MEWSFLVHIDCWRGEGAKVVRVNGGFVCHYNKFGFLFACFALFWFVCFLFACLLAKERERLWDGGYYMNFFNLKINIWKVVEGVLAYGVAWSETHYKMVIREPSGEYAVRKYIILYLGTDSWGLCQ